MITQIEVENYKSIEKLTLNLGRINIFIGENGAGKSNMLEAVALAAATAAHKLDNEFLASRGIRVTNPEQMRTNFPESDVSESIKISVMNSNGVSDRYKLENDNKPYSKWRARITPENIKFEEEEMTSLILELAESVKTTGADSDKEETLELLLAFRNAMKSQEKKDAKISLPFSKMAAKFAQTLLAQDPKRIDAVEQLSNFVIYSPENTSLRTFEKVGQIEPLGINGEGLFKLLSVYAQKNGEETLNKVKESLKVLDWFSDFHPLLNSTDARIFIKDRYLAPEISDFDHKSANEGFFFLLFYFLLFNSELTPRFFAIDNIDASLNPKLCEKLVQELNQLAKNNNKQAILTTHNPAVLDGLDLNDDEQRLFVVSRGRDGTTKVKRIHKPEPVNGNNLRLSELFIRGLIGGLPKGF